MTQEIRIPPQNIEAEKAVLGAMMLSDEAIGTALEHLDSFYFYETRHIKIFEAIRELYTERRNVDLITLTDHLKNKAIFDAVGGKNYVMEIADFVPTAANVKIGRAHV